MIRKGGPFYHFVSSIVSVSLCDRTLSHNDIETCFNLPSIRTLGLREIRTSESAGLIDINQSNVEILVLDGSDICRAVIRKLPQMPYLTGLSVSRCDFGDQDLISIRDSKTLKWINLNHTSVTDGGLGHLGGCRTLEELSVWSTTVTSDAVAQFRREHPKCSVSGPQ